MGFNAWFILVGALLVLMALIGTVLKRLPMTTSILYLVVGVVLSPLGVEVIRFDPFEHAGFLERLTELAVVVSLFTAGLKMRVPLRDNRWLPPVRLATLTMGATIAIAALGAHLILGFTLAASLLIAAILAPTDPVLASDVQVENAADRDRLRFGLTGEAGLNDGTAFPFIMLGLGLLGHHRLGAYGIEWVGRDLVWAVAAGLGSGWILGQLTGRLTLYLRSNYEHAIGYEDFLALGLIALSYGIALTIHGYGFLAVFAAGLALRNIEMKVTGEKRDPEEVLKETPVTQEEEIASDRDAGPAFMARALLGFSEQMERILELTVVLLTGALIVYADFSVRTIAFIAFLLLIARPLSVYLTYWGSGTRPIHRPYIAWFGIRGIGSFYYLFYAVQHGLEGNEAREMVGITLAVVATSVVLHGTTVTPAMKHYARQKERQDPTRLPLETN
ncbi:MAG TPA: sodium:proton antiporter [Fimbriimonas sp.]